MENTNESSVAESPSEVKKTRKVIDQVKLEKFMASLRKEQNLSMGIIGGLGACLIGALLWALITVITEYQIGYMAIAVGFIVGFSVRYLGKGIDQIYGIIGAGLALLGCLLGNFFSLVGFVANAENLGYFETLLGIDYSLVPSIMAETFNPMDLLFYGFALYEGYKFSFRPITEEEIQEHATVEVEA